MEYNFEFVLTALSVVLPSTVYFFKYSAFYIQAQKIKRIMEYIRIDWNALQNEKEIEIIRKYAKIIRRFTYIIVGLAYPSAVAYLLMPFLSDILDIVAPLNESRTRYLPFLVEFFLDEQKHFYPMLLHMTVTIILGVVTIISTETFALAYIYHICGMFEIVSYRITCALDKSILLTLNKENLTRVKLIDAIEIHQKTFKYFDYVISTISISYFILIILGVASLSINLFRFFQIVTLPDKKKDIVPLAIFIFAHFYYMLLCDYMGQMVTDSNMQIFRKAYDTQWYMAPMQTQKLLLFIMQRSMKSCKWVAGNLYSVSLEQFTTLTSMSLSYFTVLYSVQQ